MRSDIELDMPLVCTIGHSNRPIDTFVSLLRANEIVRVLDVRTVPRSRHNPQFNKDTLGESLAALRIGYTHLPRLGGLRHARADSLNTGWKNLSFRGYADYMQSPEFAENVQWVVELATLERCVLMCAEGSKHHLYLRGGALKLAHLQRTAHGSKPGLRGPRVISPRHPGSDLPVLQLTQRFIASFLPNVRS